MSTNSVSTDAYKQDPNTMVAKTGATIEYEGNTYPIQTRYNKQTGETVSMFVYQEERTKTTTSKGVTTTKPDGTYNVPVVLFSTDSNGVTTYGGSGYEDQEGPGDIFKNHDVNVTSEAEAKVLIADITVNGESVDEARVFNDHNAAANSLADNATVRGGFRGKEQVAGAEAITAVIPPIPVVEQGEVTNPDSPETASPAKPNNENKDPNWVDKAVTETTKFITAVEDYIKMDPNLILQLGGGDPIQGGIYPIDANYGTQYGQDYVCIDQFEYQPPRRDQIFGGQIKDTNSAASQNLTQGNQRVTPLKKYLASVRLPMPNTLNDSNNVSWGSDVMNNLSAAIASGVNANPLAVATGALIGGAASGISGIAGGQTLGAMTALLGTTGNQENFLANIKSNLQNIGNSPQSKLLIQSALGSRILAAAGVEVSPESLLARGYGIVPNSNMELLFNAPTLREFVFNWKLSPRDEAEALQVKQIIRFFKQGMAAKKIQGSAGERSLFLGTPNIFRMQFKTQNGEVIEGVNRIKPCAITGTSVNYTPESTWAAYDKGQPVSSIITIRMQELEPLYATDYAEDVVGSRRSGDRTTEEQFVGPYADPNQAVQDIGVGDGDLYSIRPTEVGY